MYSVPVPDVICTLVKKENEISGRMLESDYQPADSDVTCGRGKGCYNRIGNRIFRSIVASYKEQYESSKTKFEKSVIMDEIIDKVIERSNGQAKFLKYSPKVKCWMEMTREQVREKVGHVIREAVAATQQATQQADQKTSTKLKNAGR